MHKNFIQRLLTKDTPAKHKRRAATFGVFAVTLTTAFGAIKIIDITMPESFDFLVGGAIFICTAIATYSQQKINPEK